MSAQRRHDAAVEVSILLPLAPTDGVTDTEVREVLPVRVGEGGRELPQARVTPWHADRAQEIGPGGDLTPGDVQSVYVNDIDVSP